MRKGYGRVGCGEEDQQQLYDWCWNEKSSKWRYGPVLFVFWIHTSFVCMPTSSALYVFEQQTIFVIHHKWEVYEVGICMEVINFQVKQTSNKI